MTACDGRVDVFDSGGGVIKTVTIDTDRHRSLGGVQGDLFKGRPCWGGNRSCRGKALHPPLGEPTTALQPKG